MFVSTRRTWRPDDHDWEGFVTPRGFSRFAELRSIDAQLNGYPASSGDIDCTPDSLAASVEELPPPQSDREYLLLAINLSREFAEFVPKGWTLLGHDLTDETYTSSLLNCGIWEGRLAPIAARMNRVGLLSREDAEAAQRLLPKEWGTGMDHAHTVVWALYEAERRPRSS